MRLKTFVSAAWMAGVAGMASGLVGLAACASSPAPVVMASASGPADESFERALAGSDHALAVFTTAWCEVCAHESPRVVAWARAHHGDVRVLVVISGSSEADAKRVAAARKLDPDAVEVVIDADGALADRYAVTATPTLMVFERAARKGTWQSIEDVPAP